MFFYYFCKILVIEYLSACALQISCYYQSIISFIPATSNLRSCYLSLAREVFPDGGLRADDDRTTPARQSAPKHIGEREEDLKASFCAASEAFRSSQGRYGFGGIHELQL